MVFLDNEDDVLDVGERAASRRLCRTSSVDPASVGNASAAPPAAAARRRSRRVLLLDIIEPLSSSSTASWTLSLLEV